MNIAVNLSAVKAILPGLVIAASLAACGEASAENASSQSPTALVAIVETASDPSTIVTGMVLGGRSHSVATETGGRLLRLAAAIGDRVEEGAVLAVLDSESLNLALESARADEARLVAQAGELSRRADRLAELQARGTVASAEADGARTEAVAAAEMLLSVQALRAEAERRLEHATVRAPASGVVVARHFELSAQLMPGAVLFEIEPDGWREIAAPVPSNVSRERLIGAVFPFRFADELGLARVLGLSPRTSALGAREARLAVVTGDPPIGAAVELTFDHTSEGMVTVPIAAVLHDEPDGEHVLVLGPDARLQRVPVQLDAVTAGGAIVTGALVPGDRVVAAGGSFLRVGVVVRPVLITR